MRAQGGPVVLAGHSMGAALAVLAAAADPSRIARLVLISPAGLPLTKPMQRSAANFVGQLVGGRLPLGPTWSSIRDLLRAPRSALRVALTVRGLDLRAEMEAIRRAGVPVTVIGCTTDTLTDPGRCRRAAALLGADYRELGLDGGHTWMFGSWPRLADELRLSTM